MTLAIDVLGPLQLLADGASVAVRRGGPRKVLLALTLSEGVCSLDTLVELVWPIDAARPKDATNALQTLVSHLRKAMAGTGATIETTPTGYRLAGDVSVDVKRFEDEAKRIASMVDPLERLAHCDASLAAWRGPALLDVRYEQFAQADIVRLEELRLVVIERRLDALLELGREQEVVAMLAPLVTQHPLREHLRAQLMVALYRTGRQTEALGVYRELRDLLLDDAGLDPTPMLQELQVKILQQAPELDRVSPTSTAPSRVIELRRPRHRVGGRIRTCHRGRAIDGWAS